MSLEPLFSLLTLRQRDTHRIKKIRMKITLLLIAVYVNCTTGATRSSAICRTSVCGRSSALPMPASSLTSSLSMLETLMVLASLNQTRTSTRSALPLMFACRLTLNYCQFRYLLNWHILYVCHWVGRTLQRSNIIFDSCSSKFLTSSNLNWKNCWY